MIWLEGYKADSHDVYLGTGREAVERADHGSKEFRGNQNSNIFTPDGLRPGVTYYWRVDAVGEVYGRVIGNVWQFEIVDKSHKGEH